MINFCHLAAVFLVRSPVWHHCRGWCCRWFCGWGRPRLQGPSSPSVCCGWPSGNEHSQVTGVGLQGVTAKQKGREEDVYTNGHSVKWSFLSAPLCFRRWWYELIQDVDCRINIKKVKKKGNEMESVKELKNGEKGKRWKQTWKREKWNEFWVSYMWWQLQWQGH